MQIYFLIPLILAAVPATVSACEGDCIVGITNAFNGNYTTPLHAVFESAANQIAQLLPTYHTTAPISYLSPIIAAYDNQSYTGMETAIFPSYFHGKCQQNGIDPPGCPNPDCPVVCGTPGSLVHFYPTLRYIAFNHTKTALENLVTPGSAAYDQVEKTVVADYSRRVPRRTHARSKYLSGLATNSVGSAGSGNDWNRLGLGARSAEDVKTMLETILKEMPSNLQRMCGGSANNNTDALPNCSWEDSMKKYILSFP